MRILELRGYAVVEAGDGDDALRILAGSPFDVMLLDVRMPRMDGISVLRQMNAIPSKPEIILASAFEFDRHVPGDVAPMIFSFLRKPIPPKELLEAIAEAAAHSKGSTRTEMNKQVAPMSEPILGPLVATLAQKLDGLEDALRTIKEGAIESLRLVEEGADDRELLAYWHTTAGPPVRQNVRSAFESYESVLQEIRARVARLLVDQGMSVSELARRAGVSRTMASRLYHLGSSDPPAKDP